MRTSGDTRAFFKVDVGYFTHPKIAGLLAVSPIAVVLHLESIAYSAQHLTDGVVPEALVLRLVGAEPGDGQRLRDLGLWLDGPSEGMVEIHHYLEHQRSAVEAKKLSAAGRRAATSRWQAESDADRIANRNAKRNAGPGNARIATPLQPETSRGVQNCDPDAPVLSDDENDADRMRFALRSAMPREREERVKKNVLREDVESLCSHLADRIEANGSKRPTIGQAWRDAARRLLDIDGRDLDRATRLIDWCQADPFWRGNILSMPKFRAKYDQLRLQAVADWGKNGGTVSPEGVVDVDAVLGRERFSLPDPPADLEVGSVEYQQWAKASRDEWQADRERRAQQVLARRREAS